MLKCRVAFLFAGILSAGVADAQVALQPPALYCQPDAEWFTWPTIEGAFQSNSPMVVSWQGSELQLVPSLHEDLSADIHVIGTPEDWTSVGAGSIAELHVLAGLAQSATCSTVLTALVLVPIEGDPILVPIGTVPWELIEPALDGPVAVTTVEVPASPPAPLPIELEVLPPFVPTACPDLATAIKRCFKRFSAATGSLGDKLLGELNRCAEVLAPKIAQCEAAHAAAVASAEEQWRAAVNAAQNQYRAIVRSALRSLG